MDLLPDMFSIEILNILFHLKKKNLNLITNFKFIQAEKNWLGSFGKYPVSDVADHEKTCVCFMDSSTVGIDQPIYSN